MNLRYISTRGKAPPLGFSDMLLRGLAPDGGLYVPESWPQLPQPPLAPNASPRAAASYPPAPPSQASCPPDAPAAPNASPRAAAPTYADLAPPYADLAVEVMYPFVAGEIDREAFAALVKESYDTFDHPEVAPLSALGGGVWLMELFWGPTLAFKDVALQLLGRLLQYELERRGERVTIVGATSGDTGSAAIEACRDRSAMDVFILHPHGMVSDVQRRQMTTVPAENVHNVAIEGSFDDCQDIVKAMFADETFRSRHRLAAINSINFARVLAQIVYYYAASARLGEAGTPIAFAVPSGNFGNVYSGYAAMRTGLEVAGLVVGSNRNDVLTRFFDSGRLEVREVIPTMSPSMDIAVSSNLERLLFEAHGRDPAATEALMTELRRSGAAAVDPSTMDGLRPLWSAARVDEDAVRDVIADVYRSTGKLIDPHTAVGVGAARRCRRDSRDAGVPMVVLSTAHPAKFPEAVRAATGVRPELPIRLADLLERPERLNKLPNDLEEVQRFVAAHSRTTN